jgi:C1A family cysteine protease
MIHLMLGSAYEGAIRNLMGYVLSYEDKDLSDFFTGMLCTREEGSLVFKTTQRIAAENGLVHQFNSEPDDPFKVELQTDNTIGEKDQLDHLKNYFSRLFDKRVTINSKSREAVLNICIYLPMYDESLWPLAKLLIKAISEQNRNINVDLFLFSSDLAYLFVPAEKQAELPTEIIKYQKLGQSILKDAVAFKESSSEAKRLGHIVVMQNCNAHGLSLDLDWDSFVRVIGEYTIATMNSYNDIFQPNAEIEGRPIHSFGLCVLNLDKYYYVRYLLSRAYVTILEREGVDQDSVDVNGPSQIVQKALMGDEERYKFYDRFYEHRVKGYLTEGKSEEDINAQAIKDIDGDIEKLVSCITSFLNDESISLPTKRVTLAQLLGMDDELMTGDMFNPEQLLFRDTYADCIEMFVKANNLLNKKTPEGLYVDIPASSEQERSDYPESFKTFAALGEDEINFSQMCKDLKADEVKIRRQTEYIRTLEKDLGDCNVQKVQSVEKDKVLTKDGFRYGDKTYKFYKVETIPLEKTYSPRKTSLPKSVDLRKHFTFIKDQGRVGSCTSFALTSIFEYILGKRQKLDSALSERYLYYNTRVAVLKRTGHPDDPVVEMGTSYYDAIQALQTDGLCKESLCQYVDGTGINEKPSEEAYEDGRTRLVTEAMNVELKEQHIKAALDEGYPVAVSVRLFSSFGEPDHGFISLPDEDEVKQADDEGIESNHAMVICGYSDENKVFVVRNSWGTDFGEKGYCFMPYSYITDAHLTNQACIITGTSIISADQVKDLGSHEVVPFDKLNPEINAAIIKVLLGEARREKAAIVRHRTDLYSAYTLIEKRLVNSEVRSTLKAGTEERLKWEIQEIQKQKNENEECEDRRIKALDKQNRKVNISFFASVILLLIMGVLLAKSAIYRLILTVIPMTKVFLVLFGLGIIAMVIWWVSYLKQRKAIHREHAEINEELETMEYARKNGGKGNVGNLGLYTKALGIRMFMPWLVIRKLSEKNRLLEQKYQVMVNYTLNLREWYDTEKAKVGSMCPETRDPFISLLSNETLDKYYDRHSDEITKDIRLSALFKDGYSISDDAIVVFQNKLKNRIIGVLDDSLKDFTVYRYLTGKTDFEFAKAREFDIHEMLRNLEEKSEVFIRIGSSPVTDESINSTTTVLMSSDINSDIHTWNNEFQKDFSVMVSHIDIMSPFKLSFLQMKRLPLEECLDLFNPEIPQWKPASKKTKQESA